jgi:hypothetical protein
LVQYGPEVEKRADTQEFKEHKEAERKQGVLFSLSMARHLNVMRPELIISDQRYQRYICMFQSKGLISVIKQITW